MEMIQTSREKETWLKYVSLFQKRMTAYLKRYTSIQWNDLEPDAFNTVGAEMAPGLKNNQKTKELLYGLYKEAKKSLRQQEDEEEKENVNQEKSIAIDDCAEDVEMVNEDKDDSNATLSDHEEEIEKIKPFLIDDVDDGRETYEQRVKKYNQDNYDGHKEEFDQVLTQLVIDGGVWRTIKAIYPVLLKFEEKGIKNNSGWQLTIENKVEGLLILKQRGELYEVKPPSQKKFNVTAAQMDTQKKLLAQFDKKTPKQTQQKTSTQKSNKRKAPIDQDEEIQEVKLFDIGAAPTKQSKLTVKPTGYVTIVQQQYLEEEQLQKLKEHKELLEAPSHKKRDAKAEEKFKLKDEKFLTLSTLQQAIGDIIDQKVPILRGELKAQNDARMAVLKDEKKEELFKLTTNTRIDNLSNGHNALKVKVEQYELETNQRFQNVIGLNDTLEKQVAELKEQQERQLRMMLDKEYKEEVKLFYAQQKEARDDEAKEKEKELEAIKQKQEEDKEKERLRKVKQQKEEEAKKERQRVFNEQLAIITAQQHVAEVAHQQYLEKCKKEQELLKQKLLKWSEGELQDDEGALRVEEVISPSKLNQIPEPESEAQSEQEQEQEQELEYE